MKKILLAAAVLVSMSTYAQNKKIKEGKASFKITYDLDADKKQMEAMLPTNVDIYFKGDKSSAESSGGMMEHRTISDNKTGDSYTLMDIAGNKAALKMTRGEAISKMSANGTPEVKITKETKDIAGYKCTKAIVTVKGEPSFDVWFTKELEGTNGSNVHYEGIDGFMLEYQVNRDGIGMKFTCTAVSDEKVDDAKFVVPQDYRPISQDDLQHMGNLNGGN
jgi:GLPGLI family protein